MSIEKTPRSRRPGLLRFLTSWLTPLIALVLYLAFWPVPVKPVAWQPPQDRGYQGPHAANERLSALQQWPLQSGQTGPEHIAGRNGGPLYTGLSNGDIVQFTPQGQQTVIANTGGRPLGLDVSADGQILYVADAMKGLLALPLGQPGAAFRPLLSRIDHPGPDDPIRYADAVAVDSRGTVWLTDASRRFAPREHGGTFEASVLDVLEHSCTGRILAYDPTTERARVALSGLCFPNGLAFSGDGRSLFIAETGTFRILKIDLARLSVTRSSQGMSNVPSLKNALDQGAARVLLDNLPGYPDNLMRGEDGRIWTGLTKPRSPLIDWSAQHPQVRAAMLRLPRMMWPVPKAYGHLIAFDEEGRIVDDLQDPAGAYPETTAATEADGRLLVQSLHAATIGSMPYAGPPAR